MRRFFAIGLGAALTLLSGCISEVDYPFGSGGGADGFVDVRVDDFGTTSGTLVDVPGAEIILPPAEGTSWIVFVSAGLSSTGTSTSSAAYAQYTVNGTVEGHAEVYSTTAGGQAAWQHFVVVDADRSHTVAVQLRSQDGTDEVTIHQLRLIAMPIPTQGDLHYASNTEPQAAPDSVFANMLTLPVDPSEPGDFLVLGVANGTENPSNSGIQFRIRQDGSPEFWPVQEGSRFLNNERDLVWPFFLARAVSLSAPTNFYWEAEGGTSTSTVQLVRLAAFRPGAFAAFASLESLDIESTTSSTANVLSVLPLSPTSQRRLIIQNMVLAQDASVAVTRSAGFKLGDSDVHRYNFHFDTASLHSTFGFIHLANANQSGDAANIYSADGTNVVVARESTIHAITP